jgi:nitrous oxidase accessory protein NosD
VPHSTNTAIKYLSLELTRSTSSEPEGGVGIWILQSHNTVLEHSQISSPTYYNSGLPNTDSRAQAGAAPTMDLVAVYGSSKSRIQHNVIFKGNTAGVYVSECPLDNPSCSLTLGTGQIRDSGTIIWNNDITDFRQHGLDLSSANSMSVLTNRVTGASDSSIAIADVEQSAVMFNTLLPGNPNSTSILGLPRGTIFILWGSHQNEFSSNHIYGANSSYAIYIDGARSGFSAPSLNQITNNSLWTGSSGHIGGTVINNTTSPNILN